MNGPFTALDKALDRVRSDERLLMICGSTVLVMAGQGVISPVLPLFADSFGVSTAVIGSTFTAFGLARLALNVPAGIWADRRGRRLLLVGGPLLTAVGMVGSGLAPSIWVLLAWRAVAGAGSAFYMTGAQIYLVDIAESDQRARYIATNQGALLVGVSVGPAIGGLVADGWGLRAPFLVVGAGAALASLYGYLRLPETVGSLPGPGPATDLGSTDRGPDHSVPEAPIGSRWQLARSPQFVLVGLVSFAVFSVRAGYRQTLVPIAGVRWFGMDVGELGLLFTVLGLIGLALIGPAAWSADRFGRKPVIVPSTLVAGLGVLVTAGADNVSFFIVGLAVTALGTGVAGPAPAAFVADLAPPDLRGAAMGIYRMWGDLGVVLAPVLAGVVADASTIGVAMAAIGVLTIMAGGLFAVAARETVPSGV